MIWRIVLSMALIVAGSVACASSDVMPRARSLVRMHREADAIAFLRVRLRQHPDDIAARRLLVRVLAVSGDLPAARAEVDDLARRLGPADPAPYLELGHAFELAHSYDDALDAYDEAARMAPGSPEGPREGGMRSAWWGEAGAARPRLEEAVRRGAGDAETWHVLGLVRLRLGDFAGAEDAYRAGTASDPIRAENWLGLATVAVARDDATKALDAYDQVLARHPRFASAELGRAWALGKLGRHEEAVRALDRAADFGAPLANVARQRAALQNH